MSIPKYYYVIVYTKTKKPFLSAAKLPIYWLKKVAEEEAAKFSKCEVKRIYICDLQTLINSTN